MAFAMVVFKEARAVEYELAMTLEAIFTGVDVGSPVGGLVEIPFSGAVNPAALRSQISVAVADYALQTFGLTVTGANMVLPTFQKG